MPAERIVVGGSVAALVAAESIARTGRRVRLLLPERGVGGGFAPLHADGRVLELGLRLLELGYEDDDAPVPPLAGYTPGVSGHRPYIRLVSAYVDGLLGSRLVAAPRPAMVLDGRTVDDVLFTVDLSGLAQALEPAERAAMAAQAEAAVRRVGPAGVLGGDPRSLEKLTLEAASLANHGPRFHERIVAPLCDKVLPGGAAAVLATLRRKVWAPLFHPLTLSRALRGQDTGFHPRRSFHTVAPGGCGALVDALVERVEAEPLVAVERPGTLTGLQDGPRGVTARFADGSSASGARPVIGVSAGELFAATGIAYAPERVRTALAWFEQPVADAPAAGALTHVLDAANPVLRVSAGGAGRPGQRLLCVELRHDAPPEDLAGAARRGLAAAGIVAAAQPLTAVRTASRPTFVTPSAAARDAFDAARGALDRRGLDIELVAGGLPGAADSLNEQIVQGLRAGAIAA